MSANAAQRTFFGLLLLIVTAAFLWMIGALLEPLFWAVTLATVFHTLHVRIQAWLPERANLAAGVSVLAILLTVVIPITGVVMAMTSEAASIYQRLVDGDIRVASIVDWAQQQTPQLVSALDALGVDAQDLRAQMSSSAVRFSQLAASRAVRLGQNTFRLALLFFLLVYLLFFFLRDGPRLLKEVVRVLPFGDEREWHLLRRFASVSRATIKGTLLVGAVQGALGGIAFAILGIGAPILWGVLMAMLSVVPAVGPSFVWLPAAVVMMLSGRLVAGLVLLVFGFVVISLVDNLLRPVLVGRETQMPDFLILLSTLGGLSVFGLAGIVMGPIIAAFFLSVWEMAAEEYGDDASS